MSLLWFTVSKNFLRSGSTTHMYPSFTCSIALRTASRQLLFGRKPKLISLKSFSYSSLSTSPTACWTNRSMTVGIPNGLCSPLSFGMYTRLIGKGRYSPCRIIAVSFPGFSKNIPSIPLFSCHLLRASLYWLAPFSWLPTDSSRRVFCPT